MIIICSFASWPEQGLSHGGQRQLILPRTSTTASLTGPLGDAASSFGMDASQTRNLRAGMLGNVH